LVIANKLDFVNQGETQHHPTQLAQSARSSTMRPR
jgi:hypothetical protein